MSIIGYYADVHDVFANGHYNQYLDLYYTSQTSLERGIHWIYNFIDNAFLYDFKITYFVNNNVVSDDIINFDKINYEMGVWELSSYSLFWSVLLDKKTNLLTNEFPYLNNWYNYCLNSTYSITGYYNPEIVFIHNSIINTFLLPYISEIIFSSKNNFLSENYLSPVVIFVNMTIYLFFFLFLISFFFSYYNSSTKDENTIDQDYLLSAMTVEAEEEIASIDDTSLALFILIFVFGWFFYINCIFILSNLPELALLYFTLPFLYYMIFLIPTMLLYDFGIFFVTYLRGSSTTASFAMELLYDYIAVGAFFIRLVVQSVRLLLMTFTFFSLYECIMTFPIFNEFFNSSETLWEITNNNYTSYTSYYFLLKLPSQIIFWIYELLHTFFVVTAQFIAFFAMIFWLFLFLYTMFIWEQNERYFSEKKSDRLNKLKKIINLKK